MGDRRVVPFEAAHYVEAIAGHQPQIGLDRPGELYARYPAWTGLVDGHVAACAGIVILFPGVGEAWAVFTDLGRQHHRFIHRAVRDGLRSIIAAHGLRRVQARVVNEFWAGRLWAEHLGFTEESLMPLSGPGGEDLVMYAMFPGRESA